MRDPFEWPFDVESSATEPKDPPPREPRPIPIGHGHALGDRLIQEYEAEVELWGDFEPARQTIDALPGGTKLIEREGRFFLRGGDLQFAKWACERQGYVRRVIHK